jgi:hydrophobic/amphiphilic exporter-1 (mainly G- bacteria), HAE1 family
MLRLFINRPVFSSVISIFIVLLGLISLPQLPISQYPDIAPPSVTVTTKYTGANAEVCTKAVVVPLERAINGVPGMTYMSSVSGNDGTSIITIFFEVGTNPDLAAVNVQNRVSAVLDELPEEVIKAGVLTEKEVNSMLMYINLLTDDPNENERFLYNFADINVLSELKRVEGVGYAEIMGRREYAMRIWLKPDKMAALDISANDVVEAIKNHNVEAAPGKIGESSGKMEHASVLQYVLKYSGKYVSKEQYEDIVIKSKPDGDVLKLKQIADVDFDSQDYTVISKENGFSSAAIVLKQRPGSNASQVIKNIKLKMEELKAQSFPANMDYTISYDVSRFLDASIGEVIKTLIEAFILVIVVVFIFLQDWRSTLIPVLAVPVSLIGTFLFMNIFGFSINLLTLFALVLAIGIVVDNAIVVVEAVHAKMEKDHLSSRDATFASLNEIGPAVIGITLVMASVFIPVAFISGPAGVFYRQFSITLAIAIVISGINALTLTPALCALMLKAHQSDLERKSILDRFFVAFNKNFDRITNGYRKLLEKFLKRKYYTVLFLMVFSLFTLVLSNLLSSSFIPNEDQGALYVNVTLPPGATLERTEAVVQEIYNIVSEIEEIESVSTLSGFSIITEGIGSSYGMLMLNLIPWDSRKLNASDIASTILQLTKHLNEAEIQVFPPPAVPGYGNSSGFELRIQDRSGNSNLNQLDSVANHFALALNSRPEIAGAFSNFDASFPQYLLKIDASKAEILGVTVENALENLQTMVGSKYASNFIRFGQMYRVMVQALPQYRMTLDDINQLFVKNNKGEMVPYSSFLKIEKVYGPEQLTRFNMFNAALITGEAAPGFSSGDAIKAVEESASSLLPRGITFSWSGITKDEIETGDSVLFVFIICLIFVFLLLSAQYESFVLPLTVILSLPVGVFGAFLFLWLFNLEMNIYGQVSIIMLIGLLGKNAILIIEYAVLKQRSGSTAIEAAIEAAISRLRPILMTSLAIIAGLIPLMLASGAGAIGNNTIGASAVGGMFIGTVLGIFVIPGLYILFQKDRS